MGTSPALVAAVRVLRQLPPETVKETILAALPGAQATLLVAASGSGKSHHFAALLCKAIREARPTAEDSDDLCPSAGHDATTPQITNFDAGKYVEGSTRSSFGFRVLHAAISNGRTHAFERRAAVEDLVAERNVAASGPAVDGSRLPTASACTGFGSIARRVARQAVRAVGRWFRNPAADVTVEQVRREIMRIAVVILRRVLDVQRRRHPETPESVAHDHTVDQHRTRGPGQVRRTPTFSVFRELAPI